MDPLNEKCGSKVGFWNVNWLPEEKPKEKVLNSLKQFS